MKDTRASSFKTRVVPIVQIGKKTVFTREKENETNSSQSLLLGYQTNEIFWKKLSSVRLIFIIRIVSKTRKDTGSIILSKHDYKSTK